MKMEQLKYVLEIEKTKSVNRASKKLYITQQALSYQIKNLENEMGFAIIDRHQRGSSLTKDGILFCEFCRKVLAEWEILQNNLERKHGLEAEYEKLNGELILYTDKVFEVFVLPEFLGSFIAKYPDIRIKTVLLDIHEADKINFDDNFLWFVNLPKTKKSVITEPFIDERFEFTSLFRGRYVICSCNKGKVPKQSRIQLETILEYPIVYHGITYQNSGIENQETLLTASIKNHGDYPIHIAAQTDSYGAWLDMISLGVGAGFIYNRIWKKLMKIYPEKSQNLHGLNIKECLGIESGCVTRKVAPTMIEKVFLQYLLENFSEDKCFH